MTRRCRGAAGAAGRPATRRWWRPPRRRPPVPAPGGWWPRRDLPAAGERVTANAQRRQDRAGRVAGPLGDRGHAAVAGRHRRGADGQHAGQGVPSAPPVTGVGQHRQPLQQVRAVGHGERARMVGVGDGGGDGDDRSAGTGVRQVMRRCGPHGLRFRACLTFILSDHPHRPSQHFDGALRAAQGLPEKIEDETIITRVLILAGLLPRPARSPQSCQGGTSESHPAEEAPSP
jgi:hypothetical protein